MPPTGAKPKKTQPARWNVVFGVLLMAGLWILLVGGVHRDEMIVGGAGVIVSTALMWLIMSIQTDHQQYRLADVALVRHLPVEIAQDVFLLSVALCRCIRFRRVPTSAFRVCGFKTSKSRPEDVARRVLVTAFTSATPNAIIIGVDYDQSRLLFHQLERAPVSETMRRLGAQA